MATVPVVGDPNCVENTVEFAVRICVDGDWITSWVNSEEFELPPERTAKISARISAEYRAFRAKLDGTDEHKPLPPAVPG